jgi:outer membrane receptor protein involved in Fe transport
MNYTVGPWSLFLSHRFIDKTKFNVNWVEGVDVDDNFLNSVRWINGRVGYNYEMNGGRTLDLFANVTNLFDDEPPPNPGTVGRGIPGGANGMHQTLAVGRSYTVGMKMQF